MYDPQIGRFTAIDPLAEGFEMLTPYQYASNDPVRNIDLDGLEGYGGTLNISDPAIGYLAAKRQLGTLTDRDYEIANNISKAESKGTLLGAGTVLIAATGAAVAPELLPFMARGALWASNPTNQLLLWNAASFTANLFYEGPDDILPSPGFGDEAGIALKGLFKNFDMPAVMKAADVSEFKTLFQGSIEKVAVIGQGMERVTEFAKGIGGATTFKASEAALKEWTNLTKSGVTLSDKVVKGTLIYKENQ